MILVGARVIFSPPDAPGHHGVVLGVMPWATPQCWPSAIVYRVLIDGVDYPIIGDLLTVVLAPAASYALAAGRA